MTATVEILRIFERGFTVGDTAISLPPGGQEIGLGLLMALIVLIVIFRTFVAVTIPILLALTALAVAFVLLFILAGLTDINTITPLLVSMIGLGVGIDYSLFIVTRFRQLLHEGLSPADAAAEAQSPSGQLRPLGWGPAMTGMPHITVHSRPAASAR